MNLIEKLGIEKCRAIVDGAPEWASHYVPDRDKTICCHNEDHFYFRDQVKLGVEHIRLSDIRTAIAEHEKCQHKWNETTSNGDAYRFFVCKHCDSTQNYVPFEADNCSDIRNHVSPNTKVIEHE